MSALVYITSEELTGCKPREEDLAETIRSLDREPTFLLLAHANLLLSLFDRGERYKEAHRGVTGLLLSPGMRAELAEKYGLESPATRPIFHRQQLLAMMRRVLLEGPVGSGDDPLTNEAARHRLGDACLIMNSLMSETQGQLLAGASSHDTSLEELLTQWIPVSELMNPPNALHAMVRVHAYLADYGDLDLLRLSTADAFSDRFRAVNGLSTTDLMHMIFSLSAVLDTHDTAEVIANPSSLRISRRGVFANFQADPGVVDSFFGLCSKSIDELSQDLRRRASSATARPEYDFTVFRQNPLVPVGAGVSVIDYQFLMERLGPGLYHQALNSLDSKQDRDGFLSCWGGLFHKYVNTLLSLSYPPSSGRFYAEAHLDRAKSEYEGFDGAIDCGGALIALEYKGGYLSANAKYSGERNILLEDLDKKFGRTHHAGVEQLARKIKLFFHGDEHERKTFAGLDLKNVRVIYPVLVVQDHSLQLGLANWELDRWFQEQLGTGELTARVRRLTVITVDALERLLPYIDAGELALTDILDEYATKQAEPFRNYRIRHYQPHETILSALDQLKADRGLPNRSNEWILAHHYSLFESVKARVLA